MPFQFKRAAVLWFVLACARCQFAYAQSPSDETHDGCVRAGTQAGCVQLNSGQIYDVSSANPRMDPSLHLGVEVTAKRATTAGACATGIALDQIRWRYTNQHCP